MHGGVLRLFLQEYNLSCISLPVTAMMISDKITYSCNLYDQVILLKKGIGSMTTSAAISKQLASNVFAYLNATSWTQAKQIVQKHPDLLSDEASSIILKLIEERIDDAGEVGHLQLHLDVLNNCRLIGVDTTFKEFDDKRLWSGPNKLTCVAIFLGVCIGVLFTLNQAGISWLEISKYLFVIIGLIILCSWLYWEWAWYRGNYGFVPLKVRFLVIQSMLLELGVEWQFIKIKPDQTHSMIILMKSLQEILRSRKKSYTTASLHSYIGSRWRDIQAGERASNLDQSLFHYKEALKFFTKETWKRPWIETQISLISVYKQKVSLDNQPWNHRINDLLTILDLYSEVLDISDQLPLLDRAHLQLDYARILFKIYELTKMDLIQSAIDACLLALTILTEKEHLEDWAECNSLLGSAYAELHNWELAIEYHEQASRIFNLNTSSYNWIHSQLSLGRIYFERYKDLKDIGNMAKAIYYAECAWRAYEQNNLPWASINAAFLLAKIYLVSERWEAAYEALAIVMRYKQDAFTAAYTPTGRFSEVASTSLLYPSAAYCLLKLNRFDEALVCLEAGKTRLLWEALAIHITELETLPFKYKNSIQELMQDIRRAESAYRSFVDIPSANKLLRKTSIKLKDLRSKFNNLLQQIRQEIPEIMPEILSIKDILATIPQHSALVTSVFTSQGNAAIVVPYGADKVTQKNIIWLDSLEKDDLNSLLYGTSAYDGWLKEYNSLRKHIVGIEKSEKQYFLQWKVAIERITGQVWDRFVDPINTLLKDLKVTRVVILSGGLALIPLQAAWRLVDGQKNYFIDDYEISYAPSVYALAVAQRNVARTTDKLALIAGVSIYNSPMAPLKYSRAEAETVAQLFNTVAIVDAAATYEAVITTAPGKTYLHLSCHGEFAWGDDPLSSRLYLYDKPLTLLNIIDKLDMSSTRLVVLSACETGISDASRNPDEFIGLPMGFMQAGVAGVISSLWPVDDRSTSLLMERFYVNHLDNDMSPTKALQEAQVWIRNLTRGELLALLEKKNEAHDVRRTIRRGGLKDDRIYEDPYYWAAFTVNGI
jgi:CHAT domain-containing protein/tetratricopeptide (TPR) repeat protein